jgi:hypothetical protein
LERKIHLKSEKKPFGLSKTLVYSAIFGVSISLAYRSGNDFAGVSPVFVFSDILPFVDPALQGLMMLVSIVVAVLSIYRLSKFFTKIYEQKSPGIFIAFLGFCGSILILLAPQANIHFILVGVGCWIIGIVMVTTFRNLN